MGQKVNPHGLRVGVIKDWDSRWFARDDAFGDILVEDYKLRKFIKKSLYAAGVPQHRNRARCIKSQNPHPLRQTRSWSSARGGAEIEKLRAQLSRAMLGKPGRHQHR